MALSKHGSGSTQELFKLSVFNICKFINHTMRIKGFNKLLKPWISLFSKRSRHMWQIIFSKDSHPNTYHPTCPYNEWEIDTFSSGSGVCFLPWNPGGPPRVPQPKEHDSSDTAWLQRMHHKQQHGICLPASLSLHMTLMPEATLWKWSRHAGENIPGDHVGIKRCPVVPTPTAVLFFLAQMLDVSEKDLRWLPPSSDPSWCWVEPKRAIPAWWILLRLQISKQNKCGFKTNTFCSALFSTTIAGTTSVTVPQLQS